MDALPQNATAEEVESEILFHHTLLVSLDPEDYAYDSRREDIERDIGELEAYLDRLRPQYDGSRGTPPPGNDRVGRHDFDLPSRDRDDRLHSHLPISPLGGRTTGEVLGSALIPPPAIGNSHEVGTAASSSAHRSTNKRDRGSWSFASLDGPTSSKKFRRDDDLASTTSSTVGTPATIDSLEEEEAALERRHGLNFSNAREVMRRKMLEQQRQEELRRKREWDDAQLARTLEAQERVETPTIPIPPAPQRTYQATVNREGQIKRQPLPAAAPPTAFDTRPLHQFQGHRPPVKSEPGPAHPSQASVSVQRRSEQISGPQSRHAMTPDFGTKPLAGEESSDSDFAEITPDQFRLITSPRSRVAPLPRLPPNGYVANGFVPHGWVPAAPYSMTTGGSSVYNPIRENEASALERAMQSVRAAGASAGSWWETLNSVLSTASPYAHPGNPAFAHGQVGLGVGGLAYPSNDLYDDSDMEELIHRRIAYESHGRYDSAQAKEELQKLLENIRPDELIPPEQRDQPIELKCRLHEHQKLGLAWLKKQEEGTNKGGILADDMGLGKTIQALALIVARQSDDPARKTTLIIAPVALMRQWQEEIKDQIQSRYRLSSFIFHGAQKGVTFATLSKYDIVITTFGKVANEYRLKSQLELRRQNDPTAQPRPTERLTLLAEEARWYRVIIDEAQCIKNKNTKTASGACHLNAIYRLCMTGTPMMNHVGELYSLIRFLKIKPYDSDERFRKDFKSLSSGAAYGRERAMQAFQALLKAILLRRTKKSMIDGKPILQLPERTTEVIHAVFDEDEQNFYKAVEQEARLAVNKYLQAGKVGRNYTYILVKLLRLRQACCHPHLIKDFAEDAPGDLSVETMRDLAATLDQSVVARLKATDGNFECPICYDAAENPTIFFPCGHDVCTECFARMTDPGNATAGDENGNVQAKCPECRAKVDSQKVFNWTSFKKAHLPSEGDDEEGENDAAVKDENEGSETDSEADDDDDESDADSQGDLRDFVVADDEFEDDEVTDDDEEVVVDRKGMVKAEVKAEDTDEEDLDYNIPRKPTQTVSGTRTFKKPSKGKGKVKALPKSKRKGKDKKEKKIKTLADLKKESLKNAKAKKRYLRRLRRTYIPSAKITKTVEILQQIHDRGEGEKTLIFSQFTSLLDLLEVAVGDQYGYRRYDGSMSSKQRDAAVQDFKHKAEVTVMLISLKAGNAGLNLTAANQVIVLDPFWNPFIEEQAIDRAHRLGQQRPVMVHRILIEGTVEDRIIALQEKKRELINQALDEKAGQTVSRLGRAELQYLFGITPTVQGS